MYLCMYTCVCTCTHVYVCACSAHTCEHMCHACICTYVCACMCLFVGVCVDIVGRTIYLDTCMHTCVCVCVCVQCMVGSTVYLDKAHRILHDVFPQKGRVSGLHSNRRVEDPTGMLAILSQTLPTLSYLSMEPMTSWPLTNPPRWRR